MNNDIVLTDKGERVMEVLTSRQVKEHNPMTSKEVAEIAGMNPRSVPGVLTSLYNKGLVGKTEDKPRKFYLI